MVRYVDIKVGYSCNNDCIHCVIAGKRRFLLKKNKPLDRTTAEVKEQMDLAKRNGAENIILTGGEITIRDDVFELVDYAKKLGFVIQMQTNARMFYYKEFAERMANLAHINYAVALHGHNAELHDSITRVKGSFNQTIGGIKNLTLFGQNIYGVGGKVVISKRNYKYLTNILELLSELNIQHANMAFPHGMGNALLYFDDVVPSYSELMPYVHEAVKLSKKLGIFVDFETIPFCFMQGYEKHTSDLKLPEEIELRDIDSITLDFATVRRNIAKKKFDFCKTCKYDLICEGPWIEYVQKRGSKEFKPVPGEKVIGIDENGNLVFRK